MNYVKKLNALVSVMVVLLIVLASHSLAAVEFNEALFMKLAENVNEIPQIIVPDYDRVMLDNGLVLYLVEDDQLPIVEMRGYILGGRNQEPLELPGVADLVVKMMNTGTKNLNEYEYARYKEINGVDFSISVGRDHYAIQGNSLSVDQEALIAFMADVLRQPDFEAEYLDRSIQELFQLLAHALYRDDLLLDLYYTSTLYANHPYSHGSDVFGILQTLQLVGSHHLKAYYESSIDPANIIVTIVGDINKAQVVKYFNQYFGDWESQGLEFAELPIVVDEANFNRIILVDKPDATHAKMRMGYNFYDRQFTDRVQFLMANRVFGSGGFASRLMDILRSEKGYVYGVSAGGSYSDFGGLYSISTDVAPERVWETREIVRDEMVAIKSGNSPITEEELFIHINFYNAFFPQTYRHQINVMSELLYDIEVLGKDDNSINDFIAEYNALTAEEAQRVFSEHSYPDRFFTVIVGQKDQVLPAFVEQGIEVEVIDLY